MKVDKVLNRSDPVDAFLIECIEANMETFVKYQTAPSFPEWSLLCNRMLELGFVSIECKLTHYNNILELIFSLPFLEDLQVGFDFYGTKSGEMISSFTDFKNDVVYHKSTCNTVYPKLCIAMRAINLIIT